MGPLTDAAFTYHKISTCITIIYMANFFPVKILCMALYGNEDDIRYIPHYKSETGTHRSIRKLEKDIITPRQNINLPFSALQ
jgi:hypothetical protein